MASSMPATSLNMVLFRSLASIRALLLPKLNAPLPAILIWRMKKNQNRMPMARNGTMVHSALINMALGMVSTILFERINCFNTSSGR